MVRVALIDVDGHNFPNLPLMKLWHGIKRMVILLSGTNH